MPKLPDRLHPSPVFPRPDRDPGDLPGPARLPATPARSPRPPGLRRRVVCELQDKRPSSMALPKASTPSPSRSPVVYFTGPAASSAIAASACAAKAWTSSPSASNCACWPSHQTSQPLKAPMISLHRSWRHVHRRLPCRRFDLRHLPVQDPSVGDEPSPPSAPTGGDGCKTTLGVRSTSTAVTVRGDNRDKSGINATSSATRVATPSTSPTGTDRITQLVRQPNGELKPVPGEAFEKSARSLREHQRCKTGLSSKLRASTTTSSLATT